MERGVESRQRGGPWASNPVLTEWMWISERDLETPLSSSVTYSDRRQALR